jgi:hypothetical protein
MTTQQIADWMNHEDNKGVLPAFAWPGGYAYFYLTDGGDTLCSDCATAELVMWSHGESDDPPVAYGAFGATDDYPEDFPETCDSCNHVIAEPIE